MRKKVIHCFEEGNRVVVVLEKSKNDERDESVRGRSLQVHSIHRQSIGQRSRRRAERAQLGWSHADTARK